MCVSASSATPRSSTGAPPSGKPTGRTAPDVIRTSGSGGARAGCASPRTSPASDREGSRKRSSARERLDLLRRELELAGGGEDFLPGLLVHGNAFLFALCSRLALRLARDAHAVEARRRA